MIGRRWHGRVPLAKADDYAELMLRVALTEYRATPGNRGAWCLRRDEGSVAHFEMLTFWDDRAAIARFAGDDIEVAKYYDFDAEYLLEKEPGVLHFKVTGGG